MVNLPEFIPFFAYKLLSHLFLPPICFVISAGILTVQSQFFVCMCVFVCTCAASDSPDRNISSCIFLTSPSPDWIYYSFIYLHPGKETFEEECGNEQQSTCTKEMDGWVGRETDLLGCKHVTWNLKVQHVVPLVREAQTTFLQRNCFLRQFYLKCLRAKAVGKMDCLCCFV